MLKKILKMPATRRSRTSGGSATKGAQSTLLFGGSQSKVTKTSLPISLKGKKELSESFKNETLKTETIDVKAESITPEAAVIEQVKVEPSNSKSEAERQAENITNAQIKRYWNKREKERTTQRGKDQTARCLRMKYMLIMSIVHQEGLSVEEKILRHFDVSSQYGVSHVAYINRFVPSDLPQPCIGIVRTKRWVRANKLGLSPPIEVLAVLLKEERRGSIRVERAYIDELMSSTIVGGG